MVIVAAKFLVRGGILLVQCLQGLSRSIIALGNLLLTILIVLAIRPLVNKMGILLIRFRLHVVLLELESIDRIAAAAIIRHGLDGRSAS